MGKREEQIATEEDLIWKVAEFIMSKRWKCSQYSSEWGCVIMRESNLPLIPANDSSEIKLQKL